MGITNVSHKTEISAPASTVYRIIADVTLWPLHFRPTVHARQISRTGADERIRIWAMAGEELRTWISDRVLDPDQLTIAFEQVEPRDPVAFMRGVWRVIEGANGTCSVVLEHSYRAVDDDPANLARIDRAVDTNSVSELESLMLAAQSSENLSDLTLDFTDVLDIRCAPEQAYDFIYDLDRWPERLPHVRRMVVTEDVPGLQFMEMDTRSPDGSVHTTRSGRVCESPTRITYKQTRVAGVLRAHTGEWRFEPRDGGVRVISRHVVILDPDAIAMLPKPPTSMAQARTAVRDALGANSRATMATAKAELEGNPAPVSPTTKEK